jgi:hypothetical protein
MNFYILILLISILQLFNANAAILTTGCLVGSLNACVNGGKCNSLTGNCDCPNGFIGFTCDMCKGFF